ncbi:MAG: biotin/lipoyl-binding protein [Gammaproteobacteria bacterium]|nr:biotin/lipoyl-binding protein [Gammaproteobacteria bacterium]
MIAITITSMKQQPKKKEEPALAPLVDVFEVKLKNQPLLLTSYGVISPKHQTSMMAEVSGRIVSLDPLFVAGGKVKKGQVLAQIDPSDYEAALLDAQASYSRAQAALLEEQARGKVAAKEWRGATSSLPP